MKNEHLVYAYAEMVDKPGRYVLILGITETGFEHLHDLGMTLAVDALPNVHFDTVIMFKEKDKAALKQRLRESGVEVSERN